MEIFPLACLHITMLTHLVHIITKTHHLQYYTDCTTWANGDQSKKKKKDIKTISIKSLPCLYGGVFHFVGYFSWPASGTCILFDLYAG